MNQVVRNIYVTPPGEFEEIFPLLAGNSFRLESITSRGQASPSGFWYDQDNDEWVALLRGEADLEFQDGETLHLEAGDFLLIEAHRRHRVSMASKDAIWLALHFHRESNK
jgi:cupin 2 domain-containing protein